MSSETPREATIEILGPGPMGSDGGRKLSRPGFKLILALVAVAWLAELADKLLGLFGLPLDGLGIHPRELFGLVGVFLSPWLHGDWGHLASNTGAFLGLGFLMMVAERQRFLKTTFLLVVLSGLGTWLIGGAGSVHIGASGLIYGYIGYLLLRAWTERKPLWIVVGVLVAISYGGIIRGVLPTEQGVSWEGHLCGFLGGLWLGRNHGLLSQAKKVLG